MEKEEKVEQESLEGQVEELRKETLKFFELLLPPKEVRREVLKNIYTMELSFWRIIKTLVDYEVSKLERKVEKGKGSERVKRIEVE
ncbi:MAG: hypothetical protein RMK75_01685 [Aquificaceae bacterium]|nr:hypothetical protein [Aquificaceae bacterium]MDW8423022.1 hypothetical protein [Aquificaceae bacterium]